MLSPRRTYSPNAGDMNISGRNGCSAGSSPTTDRTSRWVLIPLASEAPRNAPAETPTVTGTSLRSSPSSASSSARKTPIS